MTKRLLLVGAALLVGGVSILIVIALLRGCDREDPFSPPAPDAPEAPDWTAEKANGTGNEKPVAETATDSENKPVAEPAEQPVEEPDEEPVEAPDEKPAEEAVEKPAEEPAYDPHAKYGWPDDFLLPLEIIIKDLPEVPEGIKGPSPPIEEE